MAHPRNPNTQDTRQGDLRPAWAMDQDCPKQPKQTSKVGIGIPLHRHATSQ